VASLITSKAVETRLEAGALRGQSAALRCAADATIDDAHARSLRAGAMADAARRLRATLLAPSPWSSLPWRRDDDALHTTLVLLD
jgi:hypothetical protein